MKKILNVIGMSFNRKSWSKQTQEVFSEEAYHGAVTTNRIRYIIFFLLLFAIIANGIGSYKEGTMIGIISNAAMNMVFLAVIIIHTVILKKGSKKLINIFGYVAIVFDYFLITLASVVWFFLVAPANPSLILKNSSISIYLFPIAITVLQFRISYVIFSSSLFLIIYYSIVLSCYNMGVPPAQNWVEYFMGPNIIMVDAVTTRPIAFIGVGIIMAYAISRTYKMVVKIGFAESQKISLSRYFSPAIVDEIISKPDSLNFGTKQKVTILFCDIRDFTKISEIMSPDELIVFLSEFRKILTMAVFEHGGTLDKYIGDAVMATFGTPQPSVEPGRDSKNAVMAGFAILDGIAVFNRSCKEHGMEPVEVGIGIHTGEVFAGNIGFKDRLEYTVIGDVVNTASRIESLCKRFQTQFIISQEVYQDINGMVATEKISGVLVRGKEKPLEVHKVINKVVDKRSI